MENDHTNHIAPMTGKWDDGETFGAFEPMTKIHTEIDPNTGEFITTFPAAYTDGKGVMTVRYEYNEDHPGNASAFAERAYYKGSIDVDGTEIFKFTDIGRPMNGLAVDSEEAYRAMLPDVITFGSAYEGSGHGEICNTNPIAYQHEDVLQLASMAVDDPRALEQNVLRIPVNVTPLDINAEESGITRYAITHIDKDGMRTLAFTNQGRNHYDTAADANKALTDMNQSNSPHALSQHFSNPNTLRVDPINCHQSGDAIGIYVDDSKPGMKLQPQSLDLSKINKPTDALPWKFDDKKPPKLGGFGGL
jgi:hypothetical protein